MVTSARNLPPEKQLLYEQLLDSLQTLFGGVHAGYRAIHAKGIVCQGTFSPAATATSVCRAPHLQGSPTPITVRFSDFAGVPTVSDSDLLASPRGMVIKFHLPGGIDTDIVAQAYDGFPVRTAEEFLVFVRALAASGPEERPHVELGVIAVTSQVADSAAAERRLLFDPARLVDGIELSDDPLPLARSAVYAIAYRRRNT